MPTRDSGKNPVGQTVQAVTAVPVVTTLTECDEVDHLATVDLGD
jgi:hypothetical protein